MSWLTKQQQQSPQQRSASIHIWINRNSRVMDDCSSVSSLSTAALVSSSFHSCTTDCVSSDDDDDCASFDLTLVDDDSSHTSLSANADEDEEANISLEIKTDVAVEDTTNRRSSDWRWESDPSIVPPPQANKPVIPLRRWSSKSSHRMTAAKLLAQRADTGITKKKIKRASQAAAAKKNSATAAAAAATKSTPTTPTTSLAGLLRGQRRQRPRMPRRQLSDASSKLLSSAAPEDSSSEPPVDDEPALQQHYFSERLRRFPMDLPTKQRKLPTRAHRIRRLTRPCRGGGNQEIENTSPASKHQRQPQRQRS